MANVDFLEDTGKWVLLPSICDHIALSQALTMGVDLGLGSTTQCTMMPWKPVMTLLWMDGIPNDLLDIKFHLGNHSWQR